MQVARSLKLVATAALSSIVATLAVAGPMDGLALAAQKQRAVKPGELTAHWAANATLTNGYTNSATVYFTWTPLSGESYSCSIDALAPASCTNRAPVVTN